MSEAVQRSSSLSCMTCRTKKIRCSRTIPTCEHCKVHGIDCGYPERVQRKPRKKVSHLDDPNSPLSVILERLRKIEQRVVGLDNGQPEQDIDSSPSRADETPTGTQHQLSPGSLRFNTDSVSSSPNSTSSTPPRALDLSHPPPDVDIVYVLTDAISQVQNLRLRDIAKAGIATGITLPKELVHRWINNYFTYVPHEALLTLIDAKLIKMIPDLIDMSHVHLDASIVVIYYGILYHGSSLPADLDDANTEYARQAYLCGLRILPIWQREATGTLTDFVAAMFMSRAAAENFDYELTWQMYKLACEYATGLNMHNLDSKDALSDIRQTTGDADRRGFWELIQIDCFFRLFHNKPATLTSSLSSWRVNFPWLSPESEPDMHAVPTISFLVSSRITLTLIHFFQILEENGNDKDRLPKVEKLCEDIEELFRNWQLEEWLQEAHNNHVHSWLIIEVFMTGYTCILFMLRKFDILEGVEHPATLMAIHASRKILKAICHILTQFPVVETMSMMVGFFQAFVPYGCVANNILRSSNPATLSSDLELLERVAEKIVVLAENEKDLRPLSQALQKSNQEVRKWIEAKSMDM